MKCKTHWLETNSLTNLHYFQDRFCGIIKNYFTCLAALKLHSLFVHNCTSPTYLRHLNNALLSWLLSTQSLWPSFRWFKANLWYSLTWTRYCVGTVVVREINEKKKTHHIISSLHRVQSWLIKGEEILTVQTCYEYSTRFCNQSENNLKEFIKEILNDDVDDEDEYRATLMFA